jgi:D-glycero-D-manno-heptose 1,7-bisphosphate phosphatase
MSEAGRAPSARPGRPAAFLDRDGTIIVEREYLADPEGVQLIPGAVDGLRALRKAGFALVVVTNQSGIARGLYDRAAFDAVQLRLEQELARNDIRLDGVYLCPHHPEVDGPCDCRKPAPGLYRRAAQELGLDPARSLFIGDKPSDVRAAASFGGTGVLVRTGYGAASEIELGHAQLVVLADLASISGWLASSRPSSCGPGPERALPEAR